jgi:hypothetical protein
MTANPADPGTQGTANAPLARTQPVVDVMAILVAQQLQLDDLTRTVEAQHKTLVRLVDRLSPSERSHVHLPTRART